jgi:hypothetical protein
MNAGTLSPVVTDIDAYMRQSGIPNNRWYVGITSDVQNRLFVYHRVSRPNGLWIYRQCPNEQSARTLEAAYHRAGCKGGAGGGSGDGSCVFIYAYVVTQTTVE